MDINALQWKDLNELLLNTDDEPTLRRWLQQTLEGGLPVYRALRIHGRLNAVRRAREIEDIKRKCA